MGKTINSILNLKDNFSPTLKKVAGNTKQFNSQLRNAEVRANGLIKGFTKATKVIAGLGVATTAAFTASAFNTYKDFEQAMANTAAIAGIDKMHEDYALLEKAARDAGKVTTKTAEEAANALGYMKLAGWETADAINGLMPVLRLSEAAGMDLATASDMVTDTMSALGITVDGVSLGVDGLSGYLDLVAKTQNSANTTAQQLMEAYLGVGGTMKSLKVPMEESAAVLSLMANRGTKGAEAGNSLNSILVNLTAPSGKARKALDKLGYAAFDAEGNFLGLENSLMLLKEKLNGASDEQMQYFTSAIGGKTQLTELQQILDGLGDEYNDLKATILDNEGALDTMAETMNNTISGALALTSSAISELQIAFIKKLDPYIGPVIRRIADKINELSGKMEGMFDRAIPKVEAGFAKLKDVLSMLMEHSDKLIPVLSGVAGGLASFVVIVKTVSLFNKLKNAGGNLTKVLKIFNLTMLANPFTWVAVGIGVLIAAFVLAYQKCEPFRNKVNELWEKLKEFGIGIKDAVIVKLQELGQWSMSTS